MASGKRLKEALLLSPLTKPLMDTTYLNNAKEPEIGMNKLCTFPTHIVSGNKHVAARGLRTPERQSLEGLVLAPRGAEASQTPRGSGPPARA